MTVIRRVVILGGVAAGLAAAYFAGAVAHRPGAADAGAPTAAAQAPDEITELGGMKIPETLPAATPYAAAGAVQQPTAVLTGEVKIPADVLRSPPPAKQPEFVIPDLTKK